MNLTPKIQKAINTATILHDGQSRKNDGSPYISHPYSVAWMIAEASDDEDLICAALLHDTVEDCAGYTFEDLEDNFGKRVAEIVRDVSEHKDPLSTEDKRQTWKKRKEEYLQRLQSAPFEAKALACADKLHNLKSLIEDYQKQGDDIWNCFNASKEEKIWLDEQVLEMINDLPENFQPLVEKYKEQVNNLKKIVQN